MDLVFAQIQRSAHRLAVGQGRYGIRLFSRLAAERAVRRIHILGGVDAEHGARQTTVGIYWDIATILLPDGRKHLAALVNTDDPFLCCVVFGHGHGGGAPVHGKAHRCSVQHIPVCRTLLNQFIVPAAQLFGQAELAGGIGEEGVDVRWRRVADMLGDKYAGVQILHLKADPCHRDDFSAFRIPFHDVDGRLKGGVIQNVGVYFSMLSERYLEGGQQFVSGISLDLLDHIHAIGQRFGEGKALLIGYQPIPFLGAGICIGACRAQIYLKFCTDFRMLDLCAAVVGVLDQLDLTLFDWLF